MTITYCAKCGAENPAQPCPQCGQTGTTTEPPSQEPCAYCGARPTWAVVWEHNEGKDTIYLCAACDDAEAREVET